MNKFEMIDKYIEAAEQLSAKGKHNSSKIANRMAIIRMRQIKPEKEGE